MIFHIATEADWKRRTDSYAPPEWRTVGFIHCSTEDQLVRVANRLFAGRRDLLLLEIDPTLLSALVVWEDGEGTGEDFPHVYGRIEVAAVVSATSFAADRDGLFDWWSAPPG